MNDFDNSRLSARLRERRGERPYRRRCTPRPSECPSCEPCVTLDTRSRPYWPQAASRLAEQLQTHDIQSHMTQEQRHMTGSIVMRNKQGIFIQVKILKQCNAMQCNAMQCNAMQCNAMQCNAMQCNASQCNTIQFISTFIHVNNYYKLNV